MIVGVLSVKAIDLADAWFVGRLGAEPLAAISFAFPIVMTLVSLSIGLGSGASSVLARAIGGNGGAQARRAQRRIVGGALLLTAVLSLAAGVVGGFAIAPLLALLGADGERLADAVTYMRIWFAGGVFLFVPVVATGLLRAAGHGVAPALLMALTALLNIALDPLFIFGIGPMPALGLAGAAVATVIARVVVTAITLWFLCHTRLLALDPRSAVAGLATHAAEMARVGGPAALSTSLNPVAIAVVTAAVATIDASAVAAFGVAARIQDFAVVPLLALSSASAPVAGQNSGAGETGRTRRALYWCAAISLAWSVIVAAGLLLGGTRLVGWFTASEVVLAHATTYLSIVPVSYVGYGLTIATSAAMNGLGRSAVSLALSGGRAMLLLAPAAWLGVLWAGFSGLAFGTLAANFVSGVIALSLVRRHALTVRARPASREGAPVPTARVRPPVAALGRARS